MAFTWDKEKEEELKSLWHKGFSARQIADKMGGVSRNAVIGKAHRLGLSQRAATPQREIIITYFARERVCQWPFGDPLQAAFHICGKQVEKNKPYCGVHCRKAYRRLSITEADRELAKSHALLELS